MDDFSLISPSLSALSLQNSAFHIKKHIFGKRITSNFDLKRSVDKISYDSENISFPKAVTLQ